MLKCIKGKRHVLHEIYRNAVCVIVLAGLVCLSFTALSAQSSEKEMRGADQKTPSRAYFFDWINSQYEGSTEAQALTNLEFFKWLHDEYGMDLDIYSLDVGNIDDGPYCAGIGRMAPYQCGTLNSEDFKKQFPNGFGPLSEKAASFGCRLGIWLGPDGFGDTPEEEKERADMYIKFCRDHNFMLFKFDGCAGRLRPEKQDVFVETIKKCREYCPDLILLNERIEFGKAEPYTTTFLWEGIETYIDVFSNNTQTATHHRMGALIREFPPELNRLIEDHGVCISSCLDFWEDDLVLQSFNRGTILAPEIYGNPWFLNDDEYPKLARLCNLHRRYDDILVNAKELPEKVYGPYAVSRGDENTRLITLRNTGWEPVTYNVKLDESIGLGNAKEIELRRYHPSEKIIGKYKWGSEVAVEVLPFRSCLVMATSEPCSEIGITGCDYEIVRDTPGKPVKIKLLGMPGTTANVALSSGDQQFSKATLDGKNFKKVLKTDITKKKEVAITFEGEVRQGEWHRKIGDLKSCKVPAEAEALYEATCYAADNNALEVRSVQRSGPSDIPQVQASRQMFLEKPMFVNRAIWDKNLFDGDIHTFFIARMDEKALRVDFGDLVNLDEIRIKIRDRQERDINRKMHAFDDDAVVEVSPNLKDWTALELGRDYYGTIAIAKMRTDQAVRYVRVHGAPQRIAEIEAFKSGKMLDRSKWRASNLFDSYSTRPIVDAWKMTFTPNEIAKNSYLAVAMNGNHGDEGVYSALLIDGKPYGAPDRAVSFPSNTWEYYNVEMESDYTYYFPLSEDMIGKKIDVFALIRKDGVNEIQPEAWITAYPIPFESRELILYENK